MSCMIVDNPIPEKHIPVLVLLRWRKLLLLEYIKQVSLQETTCFDFLVDVVQLDEVFADDEPNIFSNSFL